MTKIGTTMARALTKKRIIAPERESTPVREATPAEIMEILDRRARRELGITGADFLRRWFNAHYAADPDQPGVIECAVLAPFVEDYWRHQDQG